MPDGDRHGQLLPPPLLWRWRCAAAAVLVVGLVLPAVGGTHHVTFDQSEMSDILPCVEALTPCQTEVRKGQVTAACCFPLSDLVVHNPECICAMFFNTDLLENFNLTRDRALDVAVNCHVPVSMDYCKKFITQEQSEEMYRYLAPSPFASIPPSGGGHRKNGPNASGSPPYGLASALAITVIISNMIFF